MKTSVMVPCALMLAAAPLAPEAAPSVGSDE